MSPPLWKILLKALRSDRTEPLTCEECFSILEYLADKAAAGADPDRLRVAVENHLNQCPDCHEHYLRRLAQLESALFE